MCVDIVVTWVDGSDPEWLEEKRKYSNTKLRQSDQGDSITRYRDWGLMRYWFRSIEKNAPWVRKVLFITVGHVPQWLNLDCPKLEVVLHSDFIPQEYLPTFSARPIAFNLHRIKGLSEHFVKFDDDMFLNLKTKESDFFVNNLPCDFLKFGLITSSTFEDDFCHIYLNNNGFLNKNYSCNDIPLNKMINIKYSICHNLRNIILSRVGRITRFSELHSPLSLSKETIKKAWKMEPELLHQTCLHKFRHHKDVNPWIFRDLQLVTGDFYPVSPTNRAKCYRIGTDNDDIKKVIGKKYKMICLNDEAGIEESLYLKYKKELIESFERVYPEKSIFEKE